MSPELDDALCAKYPFIFAGRHGDPATTAMCWGFEVGDGWFPLIDVLCEELQRETDQRGAPQIVATQVKQKHGELRFSVDVASERQYGMIELAKAASRQMCETCGAPAMLDEKRGARMSIRCPACRGIN
jgi:hypothetical protein